MVELKGELCNFCNEKALTLREEKIDVQHFGQVYVFTMECSSCGYKKSDIEPAEKKEPCRYMLEVTSEADLNIRIVKSGEASVKIPHIITIEPGPAANGYVTNVEGLLQQVKSVIQSTMDNEEDPAAKKKAKNLLKKLDNALLGREPLKIIIEDETGHSAIISEKAQRSKL